MRFKAAFLIVFGLSIGVACTDKPAREPSSVDDNENGIAPNSAAIEHVVEDSLKNPATQAAVKAELKRALLSDPSQDTGEPLVLNEYERGMAKEGLDKKLLKHTENATAALRELGQMSRGLLGNQTIQFSANADFRCVSIEETASATKSEVLISKPVVGAVTVMRFRPHQGLDPTGGSDFTAQMRAANGALVYETEEKVSFVDHGSLETDAGAVLGAHLKGVIKEQEIDKDFSCTRGKD